MLKAFIKVNIKSLYLLIYVFLYTLLQVQRQSNLIYLKLSEFVFYPWENTITLSKYD